MFKQHQQVIKNPISALEVMELTIDLACREEQPVRLTKGLLNAFEQKKLLTDNPLSILKEDLQEGGSPIRAQYSADLYQEDKRVIWYCLIVNHLITKDDQSNIEKIIDDLLSLKNQPIKPSWNKAMCLLLERIYKSHPTKAYRWQYII